MDKFAQILLDRLVAYLMSHPELLDELIAALINALMKSAKGAK